MSEVNSYIGESAVDLSIRGFRHLEGLVRFCVDNGLAIDHVESAATVGRLVDDLRKAELKNNKPMLPPKPNPRAVPVLVNNGQNLVDLAIQEMGSVEGYVAFLKGNGFDPLDDPAAGTELKALTADVVDAEVRDFYRAQGYKVNTGETSGEAGEILGIGFMIIEDTFTVG